MEFISSNSVVRLQNPGVVSRQLLNPENSSSERVTITEVHLEIGACQPRHTHDVSEQIWYATKGTGKLLLAVLVNDATVSSGDVLTHLLSQCPNVTVMGITSSSNSVQTVGGCCYLSDDMFEVYYPIINSLDENNEILEVTADRQAKVGFDLRIPVDYDAAMMIFGDSEKDYEIDYAVDYLYNQEQ